MYTRSATKGTSGTNATSIRPSESNASAVGYENLILPHLVNASTRKFFRSSPGTPPGVVQPAVLTVAAQRWTILLSHIISARPSKQPLMVRTFLKVYMELGFYFLFLQEQITDIIIKTAKQPSLSLKRHASESAQSTLPSAGTLSLSVKTLRSPTSKSFTGDAPRCSLTSSRHHAPLRLLSRFAITSSDTSPRSWLMTTSDYSLICEDAWTQHPSLRISGRGSVPQP